MAWIERCLPLDTDDADEQNDGTNEDSNNDDHNAWHCWKHQQTHLFYLFILKFISPQLETVKTIYTLLARMIVLRKVMTTNCRILINTCVL